MILRADVSPTLTKPKQLTLSNAVVFFDFDNTVTTFDVLDDILVRFSVDEKWRKLEEEWQAGRLGSKDCLEGQLQSIRVTKETLSRYLAAVPIDRGFKKLLAFLKKRKIPTMIVSDNFSFMVREILRHNSITGIRVYTNHVRFKGDQLVPSFPYFDVTCPRCAHCKKTHLLTRSDKTLIYVGDGLSDVCPAEEADWVFAKGSLLETLRKNQKPCIPFGNLGDVYHKISELDNATEPENI